MSLPRTFSVADLARTLGKAEKTVYMYVKGWPSYNGLVCNADVLGWPKDLSPLEKQVMALAVYLDEIEQEVLDTDAVYEYLGIQDKEVLDRLYTRGLLLQVEPGSYIPRR